VTVVQAFFLVLFAGALCMLPLELQAELDKPRVDDAPA
jgi:hypothetical protein